MRKYTVPCIIAGVGVIAVLCLLVQAAAACLALLAVLASVVFLLNPFGILDKKLSNFAQKSVGISIAIATGGIIFGATWGTSSIAFGGIFAGAALTFAGLKLNPFIMCKDAAVVRRICNTMAEVNSTQMKQPGKGIIWWQKHGYAEVREILVRYGIVVDERTLTIMQIPFILGTQTVERSNEEIDRLKSELLTWKGRAQKAEESAAHYLVEIDGLGEDYDDLQYRVAELQRQRDLAQSWADWYKGQASTYAKEFGLEELNEAADEDEAGDDWETVQGELTPETAYYLYSGGMTFPEIAAKYGVNKSTAKRKYDKYLQGK